MNFVAIKMLVGDRGKYLGIVLGLAFATLLITQQLSIFWGLMARTYNAINDLGLPDIWVMDPKVQFIDDVKPLQDTTLYRVRGIAGVDWAVPLYKGLLKARMPSGDFQTCNVLGLDDASLVGGPPVMRQGKLSDLRQADSIIVDYAATHDADGKLLKTLPDGSKVSLKLGDILELNDHRAIIVGFCDVSRTFQSQPVIYTTYSRATVFAPRERKLLSFVLVKAQPGQNIAELCARITQATRLEALTQKQFEWKTFMYFMKYTGIPINFGIAVVLGFVIGTAIAGQTFYNFTMENLKHFGALKAMGANDRTVLRMVLLQAVITGAIGYGLGVGAAAAMGLAGQNSELAFKLAPEILAVSLLAVMIIVVLAAALSIRKVVKLEPAIVFQT